MFSKKKSALAGLVKQRLTVTCKHGIPMFSGLLLDIHIGKDGVQYEFADVKHVESGAAAAGTLFIDKADVAYMQEVPSAAG